MAGLIGLNLVTDGLILQLDAASPRSYPGTGTAWNDLSDKKNNGTLTNGPTYSSEKFGSLSFDGSDDYVLVNKKVNLTNGTLSTWIKSNIAYPSSTSSVYFRGIMGKNIGGGAGQQSYFLDWFGSNSYRTLRVGVGNNSTNATTGKNIDLTSWTHIVGTFDGTTLKVYINGSLFDSASQGGVVPQQLTTYDTYIGNVFGAWSGLIANVLIYNRAISETEIVQNFNATKKRFNIT